jgi:AcrR family transcriptional regulator
MEKSGDTTRARLLEAAGEVFAAKGFEAATIREICIRADANIAAVNYHFGDKNRLYAEAVQYAHCFQDSQSHGEFPAGCAPAAKLRMFLGWMMSVMWDHDRPAWQNELVMHEMARPTEACVQLVKNFIGPKFEILTGILRELNPTADDRTIHLCGFSVVGQCLLYRFHRPVGKLLVGDDEYQSYTAEELADHISKFCLAALSQLGKSSEHSP